MKILTTVRSIVMMTTFDLLTDSCLEMSGKAGLLSCHSVTHFALALHSILHK